MQLQLSLSSETYRNNISSGLSQLQQNGDLVDMTLAADGHLVKVHQVVMALASPYIKELIASAPCPHPVIFLNKISHETLCVLLEYVYTGQALVQKNKLSELIEIARELHISGLENVTIDVPKESPKVPQEPFHAKVQIAGTSTSLVDLATLSSLATPATRSKELDKEKSRNTTSQSKQDDDNEIRAQVQFTLSNKGGLQMILNRYIFGLDYTSKKQGSGIRTWRCTHHPCRATSITKHNIVIRRHGAHNHPRHDRRILNKVRDNLVFGAITEAESRMKSNNDKDDIKMDQSTSQVITGDPYTDTEYE